MRAYLEKEHGFRVNLKRVKRLTKKMCIQRIHPAPKKTISQNTNYTNLLKTLFVDKPNQVWCADIAYIRVKNGFGYAVAIMDIFSRKVLSLKISNIVDNNFCLEAAFEAIRKYGPPVIIHTDRSKQFTGDDFTSLFEENGTKVSVGERGFRDNIVLERFWRTYKWEFAYLRDKFDTLGELREVTKAWLKYYNERRHHQSLNYRTPNEVYYEKLIV